MCNSSYIGLYVQWPRSTLDMAVPGVISTITKLIGWIKPINKVYELYTGWGRRRKTKDIEERLARKYAHAVLRPWQRRCWVTLMQQNDRKVLFVVDRVGGVGKNFFANYLMYKANAAWFDRTSKRDILYAYNNEPIIVFDLTQVKPASVKYDLLRSIKKGVVFNRKYKNRPKRMKMEAKVVVMMRSMPNFFKMPRDRCTIFNNFRD